MILVIKACLNDNKFPLKCFNFWLISSKQLYLDMS
ncbi:DUF645 family protein [Pseudoalteromonas sp. A41-2]|nr:DUF645 family protein [Pseudoalteromonas sp. JSTW]QMW15399.1 DUF645 family protein [Pseudoalteromonas sp. MT33b]QPL43780.1 DUF645 family protein [Pseudoalteromonas sp. A41-2]